MSELSKSSGDTKITHIEVLAWVTWAVFSPLLLYAFLTSVAGFVLIFLLALSGAGFLFLGTFPLIGGLIGKWGFGERIGFLKGVVIFALPIIELSLFLSIQNVHFSDESVQRSISSKANILLKKQPPIPIGGLYTESISLRYSLYGLLVDRQFPVIEGDVAGAKWLFELAKDQQNVDVKSAGKKYFRLSLGPGESPDCFSWESYSNDVARLGWVQPRTCVMVVFDNNLVSDTRLHVNRDRDEKSEMSWEIFRIGEDAPVASIPFWVKQEKYKPIHLNTTYRESHESNAFADLMKKLAPRSVSLSADGKPYVLGKISRTASLPENRAPATTVRRANEAWGERQREKQSWELAYQRAQETGHPIALNDRIVIIPRTHQIYEHREEFARLFATDCCAFAVKSFSLRDGLNIAAESFSGGERLLITAKPDSHPEEVSPYTANLSNCKLAVKGGKVTSSELVVIGQYYCGGTFSDDYEWAVPLEQLPSWVKS